MFTLTTDFWITDEAGNRVFLVDGKALALRETFELKDAAGTTLATIKKKLLAIRESMEIEHDGAVAATVRKSAFSPFEHKYLIDVAGRGRWEAVGDFIAKEYRIEDAGSVVGMISRQWFALRDTYGVQVARGENDALIIAIAVCIDRIHHDETQHR